LARAGGSCGAAPYMSFEKLDGDWSTPPPDALLAAGANGLFCMCANTGNDVSTKPAHMNHLTRLHLVVIKK
jgi:hypothetical protein